MPEKLSTRVNWLETGMKALIESHLKTEEQLRETDRHIRELDAKTDKRIADLVSAIAELIGQVPRKDPS